MVKSKNIIDAVTVSIDYSDYLENILSNRHQLNRWIIITHKSDKKTINLCKEYNLEYILSRNIYADRSPFAKGRAINEGLTYLQPLNSILQLDSDILLPETFREDISVLVLDKNTIYGAKREDIEGNVIQEVTPLGYPVNNETLGYFQLWHSSKYTDYIENSKTASQDDSDHLRRFEKSSFLNFNVKDISNERCVNHDGRGVLGKRRYLLYA
jgi:hypothetical protein